MKSVRVAITAALVITAFAAALPTAQAGLQQNCYQPDGMIKGIGTDAFIGGGIYNADGTDQTKTRMARPGFSDTFRVRLLNDGADCGDDFQIIGDGASPGFIVRYYAGEADITDEVIEGTYSTEYLGIGEYTNIRVWIMAKKSAKPGDAEAVGITATADGQGGGGAPTPASVIYVSDTVMARLEVKGAAGNQGGS